MNVVVETNVAIAANGRNTHAELSCQFACVEFLEKLASSKSRDTVLLDNRDLLFTEYKRHLNHRGQPGVGDAFFKYLHDNAYSGSRISLISITPNDIECQGFDELPINQIDKSDRKFLAVALVGSGEIFNALDNDWHEQKQFVNALGVVVNQLCPEHGCLVNHP